MTVIRSDLLWVLKGRTANCTATLLGFNKGMRKRLAESGTPIFLVKYLLRLCFLACLSFSGFCALLGAAVSRCLSSLGGWKGVVGKTFCSNFWAVLIFAFALVLGLNVLESPFPDMLQMSGPFFGGAVSF